MRRRSMSSSIFIGCKEISRRNKCFSSGDGARCQSPLCICRCPICVARISLLAPTSAHDCQCAPKCFPRSMARARYVLIRPDQHVAWRGDAWPEDGVALLRRVTGKRRCE
ncbi:hypothetical protein [Paraburkholderia sp. JHI869]|uniref:aromatic-ring hydroxylase C-terminal domain-containing protein n=1 Tax=Paraburkholderia sp. JHI869 TaxID=3112959 RepID=UPI00316B2BB3